MSDKDKYDQDISYADLPEDDGTYVRREKEENLTGAGADGEAGQGQGTFGAAESEQGMSDGSEQEQRTVDEVGLEQGQRTSGVIRSDQREPDGSESGQGAFGTNGSAQKTPDITTQADTLNSGEKANVQNGIQQSVHVTVNGQEITMQGKTDYVFVDVFQYIDFDLSKPKGSGIVTRLNGREAQYMENIRSGDVIEIYWKH